ncbi:MAG: sulfite exporter TauE/SafE family protein [Clostridia bacterium]|nr:sulfite exporter TauE/SafE family protein [Clostridia bacterium]
MEIIFGLIAGIVSGLGMGGGTVLIFLLTLFGGLSQHFSQGTNLIFFIPTSIVAIYINYKNKNIDFKCSLYVILFGVLGSIIRWNFGNKSFFFFLKKDICYLFDFYYIL